MLIVHIPHASAEIPAYERTRLVLTDDELDRELLLMTDWYVGELFALPPDEAVTISCPVSRLVCDPERFEDDAAEPMSERGMGAIYTVAHDLGVLRATPTDADRERLLACYYRPHHARLAAAVEARLRVSGTALVIDAHSFPSAPLPYERVPGAADPRWKHRPAICLGSDELHTPLWLQARAFDAFAARFDSVVFNRPFGGALVPAPFYHRDRRVTSLMVEVRRDLYMDEASGERLAEFADIAAKVQGAVREIAAGA